MHFRALVWAYGTIFIGLVGVASCVDDPAAVVAEASDASTDVTTSDGPIDDGANGEAGPVDAGPPTPDGSLAWMQHFNTNRGFNDLAVNENGGPSFVVAGGFTTEADAGNDMLQIGSQQLGPIEPILSSVLLSTLTATGPVWALTRQEDSVYTPVPKCAAWQTYDENIYTAVAVDAAGTIYVAGSSSSRYFYLKDSFPGPTSFVAAFTNTGTPIWEHLFSSNGDVINGITDNGETKMTIAVAGSKLIVAFGFSGTLTYESQGDAGPNIQSTSQDVFVAALDTATGATQWHGAFGSPAGDTVEQVVTTPQGDAVLVGTMGGTMTGLTGTGFPLQPQMVGDAGGDGPSAYVVKLDATGKPTYAFTFPTIGASTGLGVAVGGGTIAIAGDFSDTMDFGKGPVASQGGNEGFLAVVDEATLKTKFMVPVAGSGDDAFTAVAIDVWGNVFGAGTYGAGAPSSASLAGTLLPQTTTNVTGTIIAKIDPAGKLLWFHSLMPTAPGGGPADTTNGKQDVVALRMHTTKSGQVVVAGEMSGGTNFGAGYQQVLSTRLVPNSCVNVSNGNGTFHCACDTQTPDGFVAAWQP